MKFFTFFLSIFIQCVSLHAQNTQAKLLEHAYKTHSKRELKQFFDNWHKEIPPISDSEFNKLDTLQKEAYRVFKAFYHPENLNELTGKDEGINDYKSGTYLLIDNSITIGYPDHIALNYRDSDSTVIRRINNTVLIEEERKYLLRRHNRRLRNSVITLFSWPYQIDSVTIIDSISDFRPHLNLNDRIPIYFTPKYRKIMNDFLKGRKLVTTQVLN